jgi:hypothetical protein
MVTETEFDELLDVVRGFIRREVMPAEAGIDETDEIPARLIEQAKEMGLYGYALPAEYGGLGLSVGQQTRLHLPRVPVPVRHQQRDRRAGPGPSRDRGAAQVLAAAAGLR